MSKDTPYADGAWTLSKYTTFIRSQLRAGWMKWPPKNRLLKEARIERGVYLCSCCGEQTTTTVKIEDAKGNIKSKKGVNVDHIIPATPLTGEYTWDIFISRLYCEEDNLQVICWKCHDFKTHKVEKPLARIIKTGKEEEVGKLGVLTLEEIIDPMDEKQQFLLNDFGNSVSVFEILHSNGGIKKGEH